ncbi:MULTISPECIES: serine/threonine-protein kinase [unclassified Pseudomonas]|uniref:serine/threonine-protein kinase n=1 Tax=unclassified Pseudomonas TaxID=196821 RepID=UPI0020972B32|nr:MULTISPECIES: serine/threonine-protein kinase [unclassified Pseudomonas]MCO7521373.1 serine/threonine protein kinase [Pseudomonas sp. 1]MCO7539065.1 serine/threonine protein kinase [Pseudomonas sp. VA159-2]
MLVANRYEVSSGGAAGGMGEVVQCFDTNLQRRVVMKRLQPGVDTRRIVDEQMSLAKLRSKNVVQLYDVVSLSDRGVSEVGIVLEYIDGKDLEPGGYEVGVEYLRVLWQIASGLSDIHDVGIIHRDIKPENIRIDHDGVVKIFDFGLSRFEDEAKTVSVIGTAAYMAPELWAQKPISFTKAVDVYAFGVLCVSLVNRDFSLVSKLRSRREDIDGVSYHLKGLHEDILLMISACLSKEPAERPVMSEVARMLAKHLLKNKHKALVVMSGKVHQLDAENKKIGLRAQDVGEITIVYDGFDFKVETTSGAVYLNNTRVSPGDLVPGCCVITFGAAGKRRFVTFDVSNPEVLV